MKRSKPNDIWLSWRPHPGFHFLTIHGPPLVGSPDEVADKLNAWAQMLSSDTNLIYVDMGGRPAAEFRDMVELIGSAGRPMSSVHYATGFVAHYTRTGGRRVTRQRTSSLAK